jgi:uncharacterized protein (DUF2147 family)
VGRWLTEDGGGVIEIYSCSGGLCGRIVGMREPLNPDGSIARDHAGTPKCGLTLLRDSRQDEPGRWSGHITNPEDGTTWNCTLRVGEDGRLRLRGYVAVPLLGQTQTWSPFRGRLGPDCSMID